MKKIFCLVFLLCFVFTGCNSTNSGNSTNSSNNENTNTNTNNKTNVEYVYWGKYPQSLASSEAIAYMNSTPNENGYYVSDYDNCEYVKTTGKQLESGYKFSNGETIIKTKTYYFKIEPIKWIVLGNDSNGNKLLLSEKVLWFGSFQTNYANRNAEWYNTDIPGNIYANNWENSDVRYWLNNSFINQAFSSNEQQALASASDFSNIEYSFEDRVFFLSSTEMTDTRFGFSNERFEDDIRRALTTDYARARGAWISTNSNDYGTSLYYWLRSSTPQESLFAEFVNNYGYIPGLGNDVGSKKGGYRPAIILKSDTAQ